ncbi:hypothetical protein K439DRAFT_1613423 [Ramaria rubella]|nr:hypothetical protein K439DRAFT_1613423 [Ramaria rubella]
MSLTLHLFVLSLILSILAAPVSPDVDVAHTTPLLPRINHSGRGTFFYPGLGNCGEWNDSNDPIIAISTEIYGDGDNCGQWVHITNTDNGQTTYGLVRDSCPSCAAGSLDMSPDVFQNLASLDVGVIPITWHYMNKDWSP